MSRDNQFMGFARMLLKEMLAQRQWDGMDINADDAEAIEEYSQIIARRAYDLACHIWDETIGGGNAEHVISGVTDMTTWPEEASIKMHSEHNATQPLEGISPLLLLQRKRARQ